MNDRFDSQDEHASDSPKSDSPQQIVRVAFPESAPYVTYTIIAVTVVFFLLQVASMFVFGPPTEYSNIDWLEVYGARINEFILAGQLWRLVTPVLLHGSITHIFFNMYALISFGTNLERFFGHGRFLLLYLLGAFTGNVVSFLFSDGYSVGASTAIFGLIGAEGVFLFQNRRLFAGQFKSAIGNIIFIAAINLVLGLSPGIDNWGHIGGLLGGLMFTWFAGPLWAVEGIQPMLQFVDKRSSREVIVGAATVLFIFGALAMWGMMR